MQIESIKDRCCGCGACVQACPAKCLEMVSDSEGFRYPQLTNPSECLDCNRCGRVCQLLNPFPEKEPLETYSGFSTNEPVRMQSSSGGLFSALAEKTIEQGGVVFGAAFDSCWRAVIDSTETVDGLSAFRGSKYMQADTGDSYARCAAFLKQGRHVLYSGVQCQIAGLLHFLGRDYPNLLTVACTCHGTPSPAVWDRYLKEISGDRVVSSVNFRDKRNGWRNYCLTVSFTDGSEFSATAMKTPYMIGFIKSLYERPSCATCPARFGESGADIVLADFWGVELFVPGIDSSKGISFVQAGTEKGRTCLESLPGTELKHASMSDASTYNGGLKKSHPAHEGRGEFFSRLNGEPSICGLITSIVGDSM